MVHESDDQLAFLEECKHREKFDGAGDKLHSSNVQWLVGEIYEWCISCSLF